MKNNEPIYNFIIGHSAEVIINIGGKPQIETITVKNFTEIINDYDDLGYFHTDEYGNRSRLGLYQLHYNNKWKWLTSPKLHLDRCDTVQELEQIMKATNDLQVTYFSKGKPYNEKLNICKKCIKLVSDNSALRFLGTTFSEFILSIEEDENKKCRLKGEDGYTSNWKQISRAFREYKNYTCENCKYQINDLKYGKFMQTHHENRDKYNNKRSNLRCLCVKCHSEVDDIHRYNFSTLENQRLIAQFDEYKK